MRRPGLAVRWSAALLLLSAAAAGAAPALAPEKGRFLVASEDLGDPNFYRTVVLLLDYDEKGAMGVVVNRPTSVLMGDLLPKLGEAPGNVYLGGPVEQGGVVLVVRHASAPEGFHHVAGELYTGANIDGLRDLLSGESPAERIRVYAGYAGWGPGQLDREIEQGAWLVTRAGPEQVFDPQPEGLWRKLIEGARVRFARLAGFALLH